MIKALVVPHMSLAAVQSLGQACRATRAIVRSLSDDQLRQLVQV